VTARLACLLLLLHCIEAPALDARDLAVIYNEDDPASFELAAYYAARRHLPPGQVHGVRLGPPVPALDPARFAAVAAGLERRVPAHVQAYALAWTLPYRVDCMSVTAAFAFGFERAYCAQGCQATRPSPYYRARTRRPRDDLGLRPAMLLGTGSLAVSRLLIERGIAADHTRPLSRAYLVITPDAARGTRAGRFTEAERWFRGRYPVIIAHTPGLRDVYDIMFYFTGTRRVPHLDTLGFLPGALADHLTSHGGRLEGSKQMSVLEWIAAGATGTYGTVVEPCNFPQKFPDPATAMERYLAGETLIEAYWKSVEWPGQGVFVGEPLASPFAHRP